MGRNFQQKRQSNNHSRNKNAKINKKGDHRGPHRFEKNGKKNFREDSRKGNNDKRGRDQFKQQRTENKAFKKAQPRHQKHSKKNNKSNLGEYSQMVGKSLFKIIPEGDYEDKFAALGPNEQEQEYEDNQNDDYEAEEGIEEQQNEAVGQQEISNDQDDQFPGEEQEDQFGQQVEDEGDADEYSQQQQVDDENLEEDAEKKIEQGGEQQQNNGQIQIQQEEDQNVDISVINLRIQQTLQVLMNLPRLGQGKSRKHYLQKLKSYVHRYYGYNFELIDHFLNFLNPAEMVQFFEANQTQRPLTIRTNTLKTRRKQLAQALIQRGVNLDPLAEWSKVGIKIYETKVPIGATPQYLAGHYMLQSASSFLPVLALDPQVNEKILDMASAPGGKTSYIAQIMKNTGSIFANDLKKDRLKALQFNIFRLGITNTVVTCRDGRKYPDIFPNTFDRVLLDAPCTGLGIISKDGSIKSNRVLLDIYKNSHAQKQLLLAAIDCTKVGGVIVYSTCSVSPLENEEVINYALKKRYVKIAEIDDLIQVGQPGITKFIDKRYHISLRKTKRIYPHVHNMDGFYLGKLIKLQNGKREGKAAKDQE